jgi:hypothetical protein
VTRTDVAQGDPSQSGRTKGRSGRRTAATPGGSVVAGRRRAEAFPFGQAAPPLRSVPPQSCSGQEAWIAGQSKLTRQASCCLCVASHRQQPVRAQPAHEEALREERLDDVGAVEGVLAVGARHALLPPQHAHRRRRPRRRPAAPPLGGAELQREVAVCAEQALALLQQDLQVVVAHLGTEVVEVEVDQPHAAVRVGAAERCLIPPSRTHAACPATYGAAAAAAAAGSAL